MNFYMLDNRDSFVYNLASYFEEEGHTIFVDSVDTADLSLIKAKDCRGIILSPGPGRPQDATLAIEIWEQYHKTMPMLGVCLGHQILAHCYGANVCKGERPMHGKLSEITHRGEGIFQGLPSPFRVTRYHSLVVEEASLPEELIVDAKTASGEVMAISHREFPIYGVQFHPEALLTEYGHELLRNFIHICSV